MMRALATLLAAIAVAPVARAQDSPWNGSWKLDPARSTPGASDFAAPGYSFALTRDGRITWQIPAIGEIVTGQTDGRPMAIHRTKPTPGLTLSVRADGPLLLHYQVARDSRPQAAGMMRLIEGGNAWVDISWGADQPEQAGELVYVRQ